MRKLFLILRKNTLGTHEIMISICRSLRILPYERVLELENKEEEKKKIPSLVIVQNN